MSVIDNRIEAIEKELATLPKGTLTYKKINGKKQPYLQRTIDGKSVSYYIKMGEREQVLIDIETRDRLLEERSRLVAYASSLQKILASNPYLDNKSGIGQQDILEIIEENIIYVDKTDFITEWWQSAEDVTLITRPRRFGKTLLLSTVEKFFDPRFQETKTFFSRLKVWKESQMQSVFGQVPVISISFGSVKEATFSDSMVTLRQALLDSVKAHRYLLNSSKLTQSEKNEYNKSLNILQGNSYVEYKNSITTLCELLYTEFDIKPIVLLDEYDTPLQEAYISGYWDEMIAFNRSFFNEIFKRNHFLKKAIITGVSKISKNSLFSDMNNLYVSTCTTTKYSTALGFTESEVFDLLKCQNINDLIPIKRMYDGFCFGDVHDIYNPWSILNYIHEGALKPYWADSSSNAIIAELIRRYPSSCKSEIEDLISGHSLHKLIDENIAFQYMTGDTEAFWSLLLSAGYIKAENINYRFGRIECDISITNLETMDMIKNQIIKMFDNGFYLYNNFQNALLETDLDQLNIVLNDISYTSMSYFDTSNRPSETAPENFYHGLVLGLIVQMSDIYKIVSNRESGRGRYDIAMYPLKENLPAYIIEFKVRMASDEVGLVATCNRAIQQINEKNYEADLIASGIDKNNIHKLGIGFEGKDALIIEG